MMFSSNCLLSQALFQSQQYALTSLPWLLTDHKKKVKKKKKGKQTEK